MRIEGIADEVAALSLDEARTLVAALKARLAIDDAPIDVWSTAPMCGAPPPPENPTAYLPHALVLQRVGPNRAQVISALRLALAVSMADAKALADAAPCTLATVPDEFAALDVVRAMRAAGATVELRPVAP